MNVARIEPAKQSHREGIPVKGEVLLDAAFPTGNRRPCRRRPLDPSEGMESVSQIARVPGCIQKDKSSLRRRGLQSTHYALGRLMPLTPSSGQLQSTLTRRC